MQISPKATISTLLTILLLISGVAIPNSATAKTNVADRDLAAEVTSDAIVTAITPEAGSGIDNIYISWESEGTDPIFSEEDPDSDPLPSAYFVVTVEGGGFAKCDSSLPNVGTHEMAFDETGDVTCRVGGLELDRTVAITVTPFIAAQNEDEVDAMGTSFTTEYTAIEEPNAPAVTATVSSARERITINWTAGANSDAVNGWRVDTGDLTVDGAGTCTFWDESFDDDTQETMYTDTGESLDLNESSCYIPNDNYDSEAAYAIVVTPIYGDSFLAGPFGATFIGAKASATPGFITDFSVATSGAKAAKVSWKILGMAGAPALTSQTVSAFDPEDTSDEPQVLDKCLLLKTTDRTCTLTKLVAGKNYLVIVTAENENGPIDNTAYPWSFYTHPVPPDAPKDFTATDYGTELVFDWNPGWNGGSALTKYTLTEVGSNTPVCGTIPGTAISCVFKGTSLTKSEYNFELIATNGSSFSEPVTTEFFPVFPEAVSNIAVSITGKTTADVVWTSALDAASYEVTVNGKVVVCPEIEEPEIEDESQQIDPDLEPVEEPISDQNICTISDLVSKRTYTIGVQSVRWNAESAITTTSYVHPSGPTVGVSVYEIGANGRSAILETIVVNENNNLATSYVITTQNLADDSVVDTRDCPETLCVIEGLLPGNKYKFSVVASNIAGSSTPQSVIATMPSVPSFPEAVEVQATAPNTAEVTWGKVKRANSYLISVTNNGQTQTFNTQENSISIDVESAQTYSISVAAINAVGQGPESATINYTHPLAPVAPTAIRAFSESLTSALVTWTASNSKNGGPVDSYLVQAYFNGELVSSCQPTKATICLLPGLESQIYDIRVTAQNVIGTSPTANYSYQAPTAPSAPIVSAEALKNDMWKSAKIAWRVTETGGLPIKSITISAKSGQENVSISGSCSTLAVMASDCVLTGLTAGKEYQVSVTIANSAGRTTSETSVKIPDTPAPVTNILATQTDADSANIVWTKSQNAESYSVKVLDIDGKAVNCIGGNITYQPTCLLDGLNGGEAHSISVIANSKGIGQSIEAFSSYTQPVIVNQYQISAEVNPVNTSILNLYFTALDSSGSSVLPKPNVFVYKIDGSTKELICTTTSLGTTCEMQNPLSPGDIVGGTYTIAARGIKANVQKIRAIRSVVEPPAEDSGSFNILIPLPATEVTNLDVVSLSPTSALASWDSIEDTSVTYDVTVDGNLVCEDITEAECEIANEPGAQSVIVSVTAKNLTGESSPVTFDYAAPEMPKEPTDIVFETNSSGSMLTTWSDEANSVATTYSVKLDGEIISECIDLVNPVCLVSNLVPGGQYQITVIAKNILGSAEASAALVQPLPATAPIVQAEVSEDGTSIHFSWLIPDTGGAKPTDIEIRLNPSQGTTGCSEIDVEASSCDLEGLVAGVNYTFAVRLVTEVGAGSFGFASASAGELLESPENVSISRIGDNQAFITWDGLESADSYQVYVNGELNDVCSTSETSCTIDIDATEPLTVMVSGVNRFSTSGLAKSALAGRTVIGPKRVVAVSSADGRSVLLSWKADLTTASQEVEYAAATGIAGCSDLAASTSSCTITGLTPGTSYSFVLRTYDADSVLNESEVIANTKVLPTPKAASGLAVALVKKVATLTWVSSVAQITNKAALPTYSVTLNGKAVKCKIEAATPSCALGKLAGTAKYSAKVTAKLGTKSAVSKEFKFTAKSVAKVGFLTSKLTTSGATLTWQDLPKMKASAITVAVSPKATGCKPVVATAKNCALTGLVPGTSYTATVTIKHKKGAATKIVRNFVAPPALSAPADLDVQLTGDNQARVWITPGFDSVGSSYVCSATNKALTITFDATTTSCLISNIYSATVADVSVYAKNGASKSSPSSVTWKAPTAPRAVTDLEANIKSGFVTVSWLPSTSGNQNITGYRITSAKSASVVVDATTFSRKIAVTGVTPGSDVTFIVVALSQVGDGTTANVIATALALPSTVDSDTILGDWTSASSATISWQSVESNADYEVSISSTGSSTTKACETHATACLLTELSKNKDYTITVTAINAAGSTTSATVIWHQGASNDDSELTAP